MIGYVDNNSLMPSREKALYFNGNNQFLRVQNFEVSGEDGITTIVGFKKDEDFFNPPGIDFETIIGNQNDFANRIIWRSNTNSESRILNSDGAQIIYNWNTGGAKLNQLNFLCSINQDNSNNDKEFNSRTYLNGNIVLESDTTQSIDGIYTGSLLIGRDRTFSNRCIKGHIAYVLIVKGVIDQKDIIKLYNNSLFINPTIEMQKKYQIELFIDFNNPFDDEGTLRFPDLSPNNYEIEVFNYTDLINLQDNLVDINSLR